MSLPCFSLLLLSEYDQTLYEDSTQSRIQEALELFEEICNNKYLADTPVILFLNKCDLFQEKLQVAPLSKYFPEFTGGADYESACEFIASMFLSRTKDTKKTVYVRICATDSDNIRLLFETVQQIVLSRLVEPSGPA
eukprot:TRINITY_DN675_c1_g1_i5.p2 TRINITY_DN675_c1_g1~~TRINITY_DN675_c1_g1_i5.p2  ORF type:complete len:137 (-),score=45.04 TRINITY_DN675_c1_g1_i5:65-475(-)